MLSEKHLRFLTTALSLQSWQIQNTISLLEEGSTLPFIARYRKEKTGNLTDIEIGRIQKKWVQLTELEKRKESILKIISEQGKLTPELKHKIEDCFDPTLLEDLYLPYKTKRKTKAEAARQKGLEPLAKIIKDQREKQPRIRAKSFLNGSVKTIEEALEGAGYILAEWVSENPGLRNKIRQQFDRHATIRSKVIKTKKEAAGKFEDYFDFEEKANRCPSHRLLALFRGEKEGFLRIKVQPESEQILENMKYSLVRDNGPCGKLVAAAVEDAYKRLLAPAIENESRKKLKEKADAEAIAVFAENLQQLLLAAPLGPKPVLAIDPAYRTGCKIVCLDATGQLLNHTTIYPHPPQNKIESARETLQNLVLHYNIEAIAIGNGTASRETESFVKGIDFKNPPDIFVISEQGASVYSASALAREEFPDKDVTVRGAVSIGRRLLDPLAELIKIDPKSIGVGQYQHDVSQNLLKEQLDAVIESCVNSVGVNLNTASKHLLTYISGLGPSLAQNIVQYRAENGAFSSRSELKKVARMGSRSFEQCAGFLRIPNGKNVLDNTAVHPERYALVKQMAKDIQSEVKQLVQIPEKRKKIILKNYISEEVGQLTLNDIMKELEKPGLDPRGKATAFSFAEGITNLEDLREGMIVPGIVNNITNFGAFVDLGIKESGLIHISEMADKYISNPAEIVRMNQQLFVKIIKIDINRSRIHLSLKGI